MNIRSECVCPCFFVYTYRHTHTHSQKKKDGVSGARLIAASSESKQGARLCCVVHVSCMYACSYVSLCCACVLYVCMFVCELVSERPYSESRQGIYVYMRVCNPCARKAAWIPASVSNKGIYTTSGACLMTWSPGSQYGLRTFAHATMYAYVCVSGTPNRLEHRWQAEIMYVFVHLCAHACMWVSGLAWRRRGRATCISFVRVCVHACMWVPFRVEVGQHEFRLYMCVCTCMYVSTWSRRGRKHRGWTTYKS